MTMTVSASTHWARRAGRAGYAVPLIWVFWFHAAPRSEAWAEALLLLGPWVLVPLGLAEARRHDPSRLLSATALTLGLAMPRCPLAAALSLPWIFWTIREAVSTLTPRPRGTIAWCAASAWLFLVVGAMWTTADRAGWQPFGFDPVIVRLTAIHFHHAGFSAPLLAAWTAQNLPGHGSRITCKLMMAGVPLTALGITASRLGWWPGWETGSATVMVAAGLATAGQCGRLSFRETDLLTRLCLMVAAVALTLGSVLALSYAWRFARVPLVPDIPSMRALHGSANAIGFGLLGLVARARSQSRKGMASGPVLNPQRT
jgi:hypothetical protein